MDLKRIIGSALAALLVFGAVILAMKDEAGFLAGTPKLPQHVAGPLSGYAYDCEQAKQAFDARAFVSSADLDGDGQPDYIFDIAKGCEANRLLYCNAAEGCNILVFASSREMGRESIKARSFSLGTSNGRPALLLELGPVRECNGMEPCQKAWIWARDRMTLTE